MNPRRRHRATSFSMSIANSSSRFTRKRGQAPFAGTALRVLRTNEACPLFRVKRLGLLALPVTLHNPDRPDLDAKRVALELRHQMKPIHQASRPNVLIITQPPQDGPSTADF